MLQRIPALILLLLLAATANAQTANMPGVVSSADTGKPTLRIGVLSPATGVYAGVGQQVRAGVSAGVRAYQATAFLARFAGVEIMETDTGCDRNKAREEAGRLVRDNVAGIIGGGTVWGMQSGTEVAQQADVPFLAATAGDPAMTTKGWRNVWRVHDNMLLEPAAAAYFLTDVLQARTVYVVSIQDDWNDQLCRVFSSAFAARGGSVVGSSKVPFQSTAFADQIAEIARLNPQAVYLSFESPNEVSSFNMSLQNAGLHIPVLTNALAVSKNTHHVLLDSLQGTYATLHTYRRDTATYRTFLENYMQFSSRSPEDWDVGNQFAAYAYDATIALLAAIDRAGTTAPTAVRFHLLAMKDEGVTKILDFDENGESVSNVSLFRFQGQGWKLVHTPPAGAVSLPR